MLFNINCPDCGMHPLRCMCPKVREVREDDSVHSGSDTGAPLLTENSVVCGEKPWTMIQSQSIPSRRHISEGENGEIIAANLWPVTARDIVRYHEEIVARLTARIRELEEEIKTMEIER